MAALALVALVALPPAEEAVCGHRREGTRTATPLERGWAQLFGVLGHDGPVAGAAIRLDGVLAATTDAEGRALVRMEREPQRIEVRHPAHVPYESTLSEALIWSSWVHGGCDLWLEGR